MAHSAVTDGAAAAAAAEDAAGSAAAAAAAAAAEEAAAGAAAAAATAAAEETAAEAAAACTAAGTAGAVAVACSCSWGCGCCSWSRLLAPLGPGTRASPIRTPRSVTQGGAPRVWRGARASAAARSRETQGGAVGTAGARSLSAILSHPARRVAAFPSRRRCLPRPHRWRILHRRMSRTRRCPTQRAGRTRQLFVGCGEARAHAAAAAAAAAAATVAAAATAAAAHTAPLTAPGRWGGPREASRGPQSSATQQRCRCRRTRALTHCRRRVGCAPQLRWRGQSRVGGFVPWAWVRLRSWGCCGPCRRGRCRSSGHVARCARAAAG